MNVFPMFLCRNGIGRSGVFTTIATVREKLKRDDEVDIFQAIKRLRMNHPQMLETMVRINWDVQIN